MKKILISLLSVSLLAVSCNTNTQSSSVSDSTIKDTLSMYVGKLLAVDCILSNLTNYSDQIDKAVDDVYNGNVNEIHKSYAYINASDMVSKSYGQLESKMDPEIIKKAAKEVIERAKDSISIQQLRDMELDGNNFIINYFARAFKKETETFLADAEKLEGVKKTDNGILYQIIIPGQGTISNNDIVDVNYTLYDYNGKVIDSNENSGSPLKVQLPGGVVPGFAQAIQLVGEGGKLKVWIPSELGYGENGAGDKIAPGQALVFVIEVIKKY